MKSDYPVRYQDALKTVLDDGSSECLPTEEDIDRYILAFSFYLSEGDDAYHYGTAFLEQKHSSFRAFLRKAKEKQTQLNKLIERLKKHEKIKKWAEDKLSPADEIRISINDFWQGDLAGNISLCEEVSIEGAWREKNIVTVHFRKQTASFFYPVLDKDLERAAEIFLSLITDGSEGEEVK